MQKIAFSRVTLAASEEKGKLLAIGSILWSLQELDVIWGSGAHRHDQIPHQKQVRCLAVRGPLTLQELREADVVGRNFQSPFFDPAIITPLLFPDLTRKSKIKGQISIIPHYTDISRIKFWQESSGARVNIINPFAHPLKVAEEIAQSERIISSSLHGLILADSLSVPSVPLRLEGNREPIFKYKDYYQGSGRSTPRFSTDPDEALNRDPIEFSYSKEHMMNCLTSFPFAMKRSVRELLPV